jgi:hypothetical protein
MDHKKGDSVAAPKTFVHLLSPAAFLLALISFLSMTLDYAHFEIGALGTVDYTYSGASAIGNSTPSVDLAGALADDSNGPGDFGESAATWPSANVSVFAILLLLLLLGGAGATFLRRGRARDLAPLIAASVATITLIVTEGAARSNLIDQITDQVVNSGRSLTDSPSDAMHTGAGFWLTLILLIALTAGQLIANIRANRFRTTPPRRLPPSWDGDRPAGPSSTTPR